MPDTPYLLAALAVSAGVTWALRAVPFMLIAQLRRSRLIPYLAATMPVGVMAVLTVYTMRDVDLLTGPGYAFAAAVAVTVALHLWRRNVMLSIVGGTAVHVALVSTVLSS